MLVRGEGLSATMSKYLIDEIARTSNIVVEAQHAGPRGHGRRAPRRAQAARPVGETLKCRHPRCSFLSALRRVTAWLPPCIMRDEKGFILAGPDLRSDGKLPEAWTEKRDPFLLESSVPGVFVAGDVRHGSVKRVASAVGEGSIAVQFMHQYLAGF